MLPIVRTGSRELLDSRLSVVMLIRDFRSVVAERSKDIENETFKAAKKRQLLKALPKRITLMKPCFPVSTTKSS